MAQAAVDAARLLDELGYPGLFDRATCRAMYRLGYRELARACYARTSGAAA